MATVDRASNAGLFVNAIGKLFPMQRESNILRTLTSASDVQAPIDRLCCRPNSGGLFIKAFEGNVLMCKISTNDALQGITIGQVAPLGSQRLLVTANKEKMCEVSVSSLIPGPCVATSCTDRGNVGKSGVGSVCISNKSHV